jgi:hypothetical protein
MVNWVPNPSDPWFTTGSHLLGLKICCRCLSLFQVAFEPRADD